MGISSCSNDEEFSSQESSEFVNSVRVTVEDFLPESTATRTAYTVDGSGFHFQWIEGDALGIYPVGGDQVKFPISNGDGAATASFDGGAWKLRSEYKYAAYYPFSVDNYKIDQKALPVSYTGQTQNGNGSTAHLGAYDYLACAATAPDANGGVNLTMKHLGAFLRLQLTMPKADTYSSVTLESNGTRFVTSGTFDLTAATPAIKSKTTSSTYTINLKNVATTEKNEVVTVYAIVAPANLSTSNLKITVHGTGNTTYVQTVLGKNFVARSAYNIAVETFPSGTNASGEDVSWVEPANMENGHEWVDLGLSVKWATCNVGASKPEEYGDYFAWGETRGYTGDISDGKLFWWDDYKWGDREYVTKYCNTKYWGVVDNKTILELQDDAAHVNWGGTWRMPTYAEQQELYLGCIVTRTTLNGVNGCKLTSKKNGNTIFLPCAGSIEIGELFDVGSLGYYRGASLYTSPGGVGSADASCLIYNYEWQYIGLESSYRCTGNSVRAVCP